ncbi:MAG: AraC family transcriptional regulator [Chitinophagaceae bacterium]|nr:MAG: AraC family transcriptional regulator [Chitinophagaceae bacterium]
MKHPLFKSIAEAHRTMGLPAPRHPLISLVGSAQVASVPHPLQGSHVLNFYKISYNPNAGGRLRYGHHHFDFDEGGLLFAAPNQVVGQYDEEEDGSDNCSLYALLIHPDFFLGYPLAREIRSYGFFSYATNEALHLSEEEKSIVVSIFEMIAQELNSRIDDFSQDVVIAQIGLLLNYANRFYKRQFITRKSVNNEVLQKIDDLLQSWFDDALNTGLPTVRYLADAVHLTPNYLSDMLRAQVGQSAQHYIHGKLIERAKELLSATGLTVSEVAYALGFEHTQSFSKLFKAKTNLSPLEFRKAFN